jgi:hypothetical protein
MEKNQVSILIPVKVGLDQNANVINAWRFFRRTFILEKKTTF